MLRIVPFKGDHVHRMVEAPAAAVFRPHFAGTDYSVLEGENSFTGLDENGEVHACIGLFGYWVGRGEAWAFLGNDSRKLLPQIHKACLRFLDVCPFDRVEAVVAHEYEDGHRWARMLGFKCEAPLLHRYLPGGGDAALYARVR